MARVSMVGTILYLLLAIVGGFLTGVFSRYMYQVARTEFNRIIAVLCALLFYVAPVWALLSLFKEDDLDLFYLLLVLSFTVGAIWFHRQAGEGAELPPPFPPDDE